MSTAPGVAIATLPNAEPGLRDYRVQGWGLTTENATGSSSPVLWQATMMSISNAECNEEYEGVEVIDGTMTCYTADLTDELLDEYASFCTRDTGGPVFAELSHTLYAINSLNEAMVDPDADPETQCTIRNRPNVGTDIYFIKSYIEQNLM